MFWKGNEKNINQNGLMLLKGSWRRKKKCTKGKKKKRKEETKNKRQ